MQALNEKNRARRLALGLCVLALLSAAACRAYVTSAILEYSVDGAGGFFLNGNPIRENCLPTSKRWWDCYDTPFIWWQCLSTSEGTLPLKYFNNNGDNLLAVGNYDPEGGEMRMGYRLTVHHSDGDPVVVWGEPSITKYLNIPNGQGNPPDGWFKPGFDASTWGEAHQYISGTGAFNHLEDGHFKGRFGTRGYVPCLSHNVNGQTNPGDCDLYLSHFTFPNHFAKVGFLMNPTQASAGQTVAFRFLPGQDVADFTSYRVYADLPPEIKPANISRGGSFDPATRRLVWDISSSVERSSFVKLTAQNILSADGWQSPEKIKGDYRQELIGEGRLNQSRAVLSDVASFTPGLPAWFKMTPPGITDGPTAPRILGVIFKSQAFCGGNDDFTHRGVNQIYLNYSIDAAGTPALAQEVMYSHSQGDYMGCWGECYYDATEDRKWTWAAINNLRVRLQSRQMASRQTDQIANIRVVVKAFHPENISPYFTGQILGPSCKKIEVKAGVIDARTRAESSDSYSLTINQGLCPSPTATRVPTRVPTRVVVAGVKPLPTPTALVAAVDLGLGCLESQPKPFKRGGVLVYFCLKSSATITFTVTTLQGRPVRTINAGEYNPGNHSLFFNALDDGGMMIQPGTYTYSVEAAAQGSTQTRHSDFTKEADKVQ